MLRIALVLLVLLSAAMPCDKGCLHAQEALLTGSALISQLESTGKALISQGQSSASALEQQLGAELSALAAQLKATLGDQVTKPINDLNSTAKVEAERALASLNQAQAFIEAVQGCGKQDIDSIASTVLIGVRQLVSDNVPWSEDFPIIRSVRAHGGSVLFGIRSAPDVLIDIEGENLSDPRCKAPTMTIDDGSAVPTSIAVFTSSPNLITAKLEKLVKPGDYRIKLASSKNRRFWFGCFKQPEVSYAVKVLPKATFSVKYDVSPVCSHSETNEFYVGGFGRTNSSCDSNADDSQTIQFTADPTWRSVSARHQVIISNDHCSAIGPNGQGYNLLPDGRSVQIGVSCSPRNGRVCAPLIGCTCSGGGTGYEFKLWVTGQRSVEGPSSSSSGALGPITGFASTASAATQLNCDTLVRYTLSGDGVYPDGARQSFPARSDIAANPVTVARPDGFTLEFNPGNLQVTATTPRNTCRGIY